MQIKLLRRFLKKIDWHNLRVLSPVSRVFGLDRGMPVDRFYIEEFLKKHSHLIVGVACEIADSYYMEKYGGGGVDRYEILHYTSDNSKATIIGDLTDLSTIPSEYVDCFICTQTLNFIYDFKAAVQGIYQILKPNGSALVTVAGISQISRYDMDRWGDYWRFTELSILRVFEDIFGMGNTEVETYGNILASVAFLHGICAQELNTDELLYKDNDYQIVIALKATKR